MKRSDPESQQNRLRRLGVFMTIPFVLAVPPVIGLWIGKWLDKIFNTGTFFMYVLLILGFVAGLREFYRIIKRFGNAD